MRGKPPAPTDTATTGRLIPARAGKTGPRHHELGRPGAHPRACGENQYIPGGDTGVRGSSPRVRGKLTNPNRGIPDHRLIPARAGKTSLVSLWPGWPSAHPRACGENDDDARQAALDSGSSPRVRGKQGCMYLTLTFPGLIPARAGKTFPPGFGGRRDRAHPRACGENPMSWQNRVCPRGSSPRVRGKP